MKSNSIKKVLFKSLLLNSIILFNVNVYSSVEEKDLSYKSNNFHSGSDVDTHSTFLNQTLNSYNRPKLQQPFLNVEEEKEDEETETKTDSDDFKEMELDPNHDCYVLMPSALINIEDLNNVFETDEVINSGQIGNVSNTNLSRTTTKKRKAAAIDETENLTNKKFKFRNHKLMDKTEVQELTDHIRILLPKFIQITSTRKSYSDAIDFCINNGILYNKRKLIDRGDSTQTAVQNRIYVMAKLLIEDKSPFTKKLTITQLKSIIYKLVKEYNSNLEENRHNYLSNTGINGSDKNLNNNMSKDNDDYNENDSILTNERLKFDNFIQTINQFSMPNNLTNNFDKAPDRTNNKATSTHLHINKNNIVVSNEEVSQALPINKESLFTQSYEITTVSNMKIQSIANQISFDGKDVEDYLDVMEKIESANNKQRSDIFFMLTALLENHIARKITFHHDYILKNFTIDIAELSLSPKTIISNNANQLTITGNIVPILKIWIQSKHIENAVNLIKMLKAGGLSLSNVKLSNKN